METELTIEDPGPLPDPCISFTTRARKVREEMWKPHAAKKVETISRSMPSRCRMRDKPDF